MDAARKQRRDGVVSVTAALVAVCAFWLVAPRTELYKAYKAYKGRWQIESTLRAIKPPAGAANVLIHSDHVGDVWFVVGTYATDLSHDTLKSHYIQEFPRHGFVFTGEDSSKESQTSLKFCSPAYEALLALDKPDHPRRFPEVYTIFLNTRAASC